MKKLIVISVIFALVAGAAFAESTVFGSAEVGWVIAGGDPVTTGGEITSGQLGMSTQNDEGTYGGMVKVGFGGHIQNPGRSWEISPAYMTWERVFAWWQPIEQVKFFLGRDGDGLFNTANLIRWGHHQMPRNISVEDWDASSYLLGNWDPFGFALIITPMDGLAINLAMALPDPSDAASSLEWGDEFKNLQAQVSYNLDGVGNFFVTYQGEAAGDAIGLTFFSNSIVDGLAFEVGGNYGFTSEDIRIGLGVHFNAGDFGVKFRAVMNPTEGAGAAEYFLLKADIMPFYNLPFGTAFLNIRILTNANDKIGWHINPYLRLNVGVGDMRFGLLVEDHNGDGTISWKLPISMVVGF